MSKRVLIITSNKYPNGDAGAIRQHMMARILQKKGYKVFILGFGEPTDGVQRYDNIDYISFRSKSSSIIRKMLARILFGYRAFKYLKNLSGIEGLIVVDGLPDVFIRSIRYGLRHNINVVHDSVEWYSPEEFKRGRLSLEYLLKDYTNKKLIKRPMKVISISSYLNDYYKSKGISTLRVPVIMDSLKLEPKYNKNNTKYVFVYAGAPGKKDYLSVMLSGFSRLSKNNLLKIEIHVIGVTYDQLSTVCEVPDSVIKSLKSVLVAHGRVQHEEAANCVKNADATILMRNDKLRYARAGFPTKVVESMMHATPVICNFSSDLNLYLKDKYNAIIVSNCDSDSFCQAINRFLMLSDEERALINRNARATAERNFDLTTYADKLTAFVTEQ